MAFPASIFIALAVNEFKQNALLKGLLQVGLFIITASFPREKEQCVLKRGVSIFPSE